MTAPSGHPPAVAGIVVTAMDSRDVAFAAALHHRALPGGFFARLGVRFLRRYLATFVDSPYAVALTAWAGPRRVGMLVGTLANRQHWSWVLQSHGARLGWAGLAALARRPTQAWFFVRSRVGRYARAVARLRRRPVPADGDGGPVAVLTHVAVAEDLHGLGAGRDLVHAFTTDAATRGAREARLITAADSNGTSEFYRRLGWRSTGVRRDHDGRPVRQFVRPLDSL